VECLRKRFITRTPGNFWATKPNYWNHFIGSYRKANPKNLKSDFSDRAEETVTLGSRIFPSSERKHPPNRVSQTGVAQGKSVGEPPFQAHGLDVKSMVQFQGQARRIVLQDEDRKMHYPRKCETGGSMEKKYKQVWSRGISGARLQGPPQDSP